METFVPALKVIFELKPIVSEYSKVKPANSVSSIDVEACFHTYFESLHRYAFTMLKDSDAAKDIVQQVFIKLWEKREDLDIRQSTKSYLYRSVYNRCLNKMRDDKVRLRHATSLANAGHEGEFADEIIAKETSKRIHQAIESLPAQCQLIFKKSRFEEKKYGEIADELGLSVKTVEAQMSKALRLVREKLLLVAALVIIYSYLNYSSFATDVI